MTVADFSETTAPQGLCLVAQMPLRLFIAHGLPSGTNPDSCRVIANWSEDDRTVCIFSLDERRAA